MARMGFMVGRCINAEAVKTLVDLGYVSEQTTRDRYAALRKHGIARSNFSVEGFNRLLMKLPPRKADAALKAFPIVAGETYFQCTHHWRGLDDGEMVARVPH